MSGRSIPAIKARMGDTDYYILSMKAGELYKQVLIPKEIDGWENLSVEERYQRDINYTRVNKQIAPYLAENKNRFFGSLIVAAIDFENTIEFEPLDEVNKDLPKLYKNSATGMGFIVLNGGERLIPLDGQHRLKALRVASTGKDESGKDILTADSSIDNEDVTVILVPYERNKSRRMFSTVNRHAKLPTSGETLVTNDDDIIAVLSRKIANTIGSGLVKYKNNTLSLTDPEFTTLHTIYNCNREIIARVLSENPSKNQLPEDKDKIELYEETLESVWDEVLDGIEIFSAMLADKNEHGDAKRKEIREYNLLGKPVAQECLIRTYVRLAVEPGPKLSYEDAIDNLNKVPWALTTTKNVDIWQNVLWTGGTDSGRIITKSKNRNFAVRYIAYMAGENLAEDKKAKLLQDYRELFSESERASKKLPDPVA